MKAVIWEVLETEGKFNSSNCHFQHILCIVEWLILTKSCRKTYWTGNFHFGQFYLYNILKHGIKANYTEHNLSVIYLPNQIVNWFIHQQLNFKVIPVLSWKPVKRFRNWSNMFRFACLCKDPSSSFISQDFSLTLDVQLCIFSLCPDAKRNVPKPESRWHCQQANLEEALPTTCTRSWVTMPCKWSVKVAFTLVSQKRGKKKNHSHFCGC